MLWMRALTIYMMVNMAIELVDIPLTSMLDSIKPTLADLLRLTLMLVLVWVVGQVRLRVMRFTLILCLHLEWC